MTWRDRYTAAAHAMQTAVRLMIERLGPEGAGADFKHNRVGINTAHRDHASLAQLLIRKGVITEEEYLEAMAVGMEQEAEWLANEARRKCNLPPTVTFR